jgi:molybdopterin adenylyltransferase
VSAEQVTRAAAVVTVSDGVSRGLRDDESGSALTALLAGAGYPVTHREVVPDEADLISMLLDRLAGEVRLIVTTGGTGLGRRDVTPEATRRVVEREIPGMSLLMLTAGLSSTPLASLSRAIVGSVGATLVVNVPGSPRGATESLTALLPVLGHALDLLAGDTEHR